MSRSLHEVADMLDELAEEIRTTANDDGRGDWVVANNMAGTLSILDGEHRYVGNIDLRNGVVELVPDDELNQPDQ
jgi:hypothetical protein